MENNENSKNIMNLKEKSVLIEFSPKNSKKYAKNAHKSCNTCVSVGGSTNPVDKYRKSDEVLQVVDAMKARIHQLLNETNQLKIVLIGIAINFQCIISADESDLDTAATALKKGGGAVVGAGKFGKAGAAGAIAKGSGAAGFGAKKFGKKGVALGGAKGAAGFKKGATAKAGAALGKFGKSGFKKAGIKKAFAAGHNKKFAKLAIVSTDQAFKIGTVSGFGVSGGKAGGIIAKKGVAKAAGAAGFKKGKKIGKKGFAAGGAAKGGFKKGAAAKGAFKKGAIVGAKKGGKKIGGIGIYG